MTRADLIEHLCRRHHLSRRGATLVVETIFDSMSQALREDQRIELRGFGRFEVRGYEAFRAQDPRTGEPMEIPARRLAFFRASRAMNQRLNRAAETGIRLIHKGPGKPKRKSTSITGVWEAYQDDSLPESDDITQKLG